MKIMLLGSSGKVGQCLLKDYIKEEEVSDILLVRRSPAQIDHPKVKQLVCKNLNSLGSHSEELKGYDACIYCIGMLVLGAEAQEYRKVTYDLTLTLAEILHTINSQMTFIYISGAGSNPNSKIHALKTKGEIELALFNLHFKHTYMIRMGPMLPSHPIVLIHKKLSPLYFIFKYTYHILKFLPFFITSRQLSKTMLFCIRRHPIKQIVNNKQIKRWALID